MATKISFNTRGTNVPSKPAPQASRVDTPVSVKTTEVKPTEA